MRDDMQGRIDLNQYAESAHQLKHFMPSAKAARQMRRAGYRLTYGRASWQDWAARLLWVFIGMALTLALVWAGFYGMEKEDEARDEIRRERCAAAGENPPAWMNDYCKNLGV